MDDKPVFGDNDLIAKHHIGFDPYLKYLIEKKNKQNN
jgi:hypothetical protein